MSYIWAPRNISADYTAVAMSSNGQYQCALTADHTYRSDDYGQTWSVISGVGKPTGGTSAVISPDGSYWGICDGKYYWSENYGIDGWIDAGAIAAHSSALSSDASLVTVFGVSGLMYENFVLKKNFAETPAGIAISSNGVYQTAQTTSELYTSSDSGTTWATGGHLYGSNYGGPAMSSTGQYQIAVFGSSYLLISDDYGVTWAEKDTNRSNRYAVAISSTGQYMVSAIGGSNKYICESDDYGATWTTEGYTKWYENICMSSDGTRQLAGGLTMQLYERFPFTPPVIVIGETWKNVSAVSVVKSSAWKTITNFSIDISNTWKDHS